MRMWTWLGIAGFAVALAGCAGGGVASDPLSACTAAFDCVADDDGADDGGPDDDGDDTADDGTGDGPDDDGDSSSDDPVPGLPCAVRDVLVAECGQCHGDPPKFGAPMRLVDFADLQVPATSDPTRAVFELVGDRLVDVAKPMPPGGEIDDGAKDVLLEWIAAGAPEDPQADCDDAPDPSDDDDHIGPDALPCDAPITLVAHAPGGAGPFHVPAVGAEDLYQCYAFASPFAAGQQATSWAPVIVDDRVVHHWILYRTDAPPEADTFPCDTSLQVSADFVAGWAPGGENVVLPDHVGLELGGPDEWFVLQVHYHNTAMYDDALDASGVAFCVADAPRPQTAGVLTLGTVGISIPAGAQAHEEVGDCGWLSTVFWSEPMHILGASPHMHELGRSMKTELHRGDGTIETVVDVPQFDFNSQLMYMLGSEIVVQPGELLRTTCGYDNPGATQVNFGEGTGDEMCFDFVLAYPIDQLDDRNCGILF
jgi:hypothetical protein